MRALIYYGPGDIRLEDRPLPEALLHLACLQSRGFSFP